MFFASAFRDCQPAQFQQGPSLCAPAREAIRNLRCIHPKVRQAESLLQNPSAPSDSMATHDAALAATVSGYWLLDLRGFVTVVQTYPDASLRVVAHSLVRGYKLFCMSCVQARSMFVYLARFSTSSATHWRTLDCSLAGGGSIRATLDSRRARSHELSILVIELLKRMAGE